MPEGDEQEVVSAHRLLGTEYFALCGTWLCVQRSGFALFHFVVLWGFFFFTFYFISRHHLGSQTEDQALETPNPKSLPCGGGVT